MPRIIWKENQISVNGVKTTYFDGGVGESLLLIHGWPLAFHLPNPFLDNFALNFKVTAVNLPGFGGTEPPNFIPNIKNYAQHLQAFAKDLKLGKHSVMGWSFGGMVAIKYASLAPNI